MGGSAMGLHRVRRRLLAAALGVAVVTAGLAEPTSAAVDQACTAEGRLPEFWADFTMGQSFTPKVSEITSVDVRLGFIEGWTGELTGRLVMRPIGHAIDGVSPIAATMASSSVRVKVGAIPRLQKHWVTFAFDPPLAMPPAPLPSMFSFDLDFPIDFSFKPYQSHVGWVACDIDYSGGKAMVVVTGEGLSYTAASLGLAGVPSTGSAPGSGLDFDRTADFVFRVNGT